MCSSATSLHALREARLAQGERVTVFGRAALVGITDRLIELGSYREVQGREAEVIGSSDHLLSELPLLIDLARRGKLDLSLVAARTVIVP